MTRPPVFPDSSRAHLPFVGAVGNENLRRTTVRPEPLNECHEKQEYKNQSRKVMKSSKEERAKYEWNALMIDRRQTEK
jgi:hypothetical protein